jgi:hypothetical protein
LECRVLRVPKDRPGTEGLDLALRRGVEAVERWHDVAGREHLDPKSTATHLLDGLRQPLGRAELDVEGGGDGGRHPPLDLGLSDDGRSIGAAGSNGGQSSAAFNEKLASIAHDITSSGHELILGTS